MNVVETMCKGKPERFIQMVKARVDRANKYTALAGGEVVSRQIIALVILQVDDIYVEVK